MPNIKNKKFPFGRKSLSSKEKFYKELFLNNKEEKKKFESYLKEGGNVSERIAEHACDNLYDVYGMRHFKDKEMSYRSYLLFLDFMKIGLVKGWPDVEDKEEYLDLVRSVIRHPDSKIYMWGALRFRDIEPRLGFLFAIEDKTPIWVTVNDGYIENVSPGMLWRDVMSSSLNYLPYEIR